MIALLAETGAHGSGLNQSTINHFKLSIMLTATATDKNQQILQDRMQQYNDIPGPRVGDYLKLPYGLYTRFTHSWDDHIQTGGGGESFYLGNGYISYSGGLDSGVLKSDIRPISDETKKGNIWFFKDDYQRASNGFYTTAIFRVFEPIEGANLSGCPQIKAYEKKAYQDKAETITRINGNGKPYTLPLPEVVIITDHMNDGYLAHLEQNTGLRFVKSWIGYTTQPLKHSELNTLLLTSNFSCTYYNNATHHNQLHLTFNR